MYLKSLFPTQNWQVFGLRKDSWVGTERVHTSGNGGMPSGGCLVFNCLEHFMYMVQPVFLKQPKLMWKILSAWSTKILTTFDHFLYLMFVCSKHSNSDSLTLA